MKKTAGIAGFILAAVFLILGFTSTTPDKYIKSYGDGKMYEYVGGDAYNYIIEAALRGGEISGAKTAKAIYFGVAGVLFVLSFSLVSADEGASDFHNDIKQIRNTVKDMESTIGKLGDTLSESQKNQETVLQKIIELQAEPIPEEHTNQKDASASEE